jgi:hypothetical protein
MWRSAPTRVVSGSMMKAKTKSVVQHVVVYAVFLLMSLWLVLDPPELVYLRENTAIPRAAGVAGMVASTFELVRWIVILVRRSSGMTIDTGGITASFESMRPRFYPWSEISTVTVEGERVHVSMVSGAKPLVIDVGLLEGCEDPDAAERLAAAIGEARNQAD